MQSEKLSGNGTMGQSHSPSVVERDWLLRRSEGLKRVRSLKLQLFCTLAGLVPSVPASATGDRRSFTEDVCLFLMLWPRGLAILTRSLKLNFWLWSVTGMNGGTEGRWSEEKKMKGVMLCRGGMTGEDMLMMWGNNIKYSRLLAKYCSTISTYGSHHSNLCLLIWGWRAAGQDGERQACMATWQQVLYTKCKLRLGVLAGLCAGVCAFMCPLH